MRVPRARDAAGRAAWAHEVAGRVRTVSTLSLAYMQEALSRATRSPITGIPILAVVLYAMYLFVGVFGAQTLVGVMENDVFGRAVNPAATWLVDRALPFRFAHDFFVGEYGLITMGLTYAVAIVLPVVTTFFLPVRLSRRQRLHPAPRGVQRSHLPCDGPQRQGRPPDGPRPGLRHHGDDDHADPFNTEGAPDRHSVAGPGHSRAPRSSPRFSASSAASPSPRSSRSSAWSSHRCSSSAGWLDSCCTGERSAFIMELPPIRLPKLRNLVTKTRMRVWWYLGEAVPLFLAGTVLLFVLDRLDALDAVAAAGRPVVTGMLGLPPETAQILMMGFLRRDYGAAGLFHLAQSGQLTGVQAVVALTVMKLFIPCVANFLMIVKERGLKVAMVLLGVITPIAIFTGTDCH
jgi:ferrous iron transport protein B